MRWIVLGVLLGMAFPSAASADVFVPADPPSRSAGCVAAAGDVVAGRRIDRRERALLDVIDAGGRATLHLPRGSDRFACPQVAVAADGTAVIAAADRAWVRRPGGRFGTPVAVGAHVDAVSVAAAPGGWIGVVGERRVTTGLVATIVAPDGTHATKVIERGALYDLLLNPTIGIDGQGVATVAWTHSDDASDTHAIRVARSTSAKTWAPARSVASVERPVYDGQVDVAVAPSGRTVLAWADDKGIMAAIDDGAPERVGSDAFAEQPTVAIRDDGAAVIAYATQTAKIVALGRTPGADWSRARVVAARPRGTASPPAAALAPDGRAVIAWISPGDAGGKVVATSGRVGGSWSAPTRVSAITRDATTPSLSLDAADDPRLVWLETVQSNSLAGRVRGARLTAAAGPVDAVPPRITARLPKRTPPTGTGRAVFRVPLRCSEACDVRLRVLDRRTGLEVAAIARALPAGRRVLARVRVPQESANSVLLSKSARRPRLEILVTDRAGNVARMAGTVRIRVVDRPIVSFRVAADHDFAMFTRAGDRAVARFVNRLITALGTGEVENLRDLRQRYLRGTRAIEAAGHEEVSDTEVVEEIFSALEVPCAKAGYDAEAVVSG